MFLNNITFKKDVKFESKREMQKEMFEVKTTVSFEKNYRKMSHNKDGDEIIPEDEIIENKFVIFNDGLTVNFDPCTVIVGDNGCGKTSFIKQIAFPYDQLMIWGTPDETRQKEVTKNWLNNDTRELKFSKLPKQVIVEKEIHKELFIKEYQNRNSQNGFLPPGNLMTMWDIQTFSNGECNFDFLSTLLNIKNSLIVLDEPETSLSIKSQIKLHNLIKSLLESNQVIVITHSEILMNLSNKVYDFEKKEYVETEKYIREQKMPK